MSLELKKGDQIIIAVDTSGSMNTRDPKCGGDTRYHWMQETLASYVKAASKFDPDGVSIHFFNYGVEAHQNVATPEDAIALASKHKVGGGTSTHLVVESAYKEHTNSGSQSTYLLVFTDGDCNDRDALSNEIVSITNRIGNPEEFRIAFLPVGTVDSDLDAFLDFLDDGLTDAKYDIVSVVHPEDADFESAIASTIDSSTASGDEAGYHGKKTETV